MAKQPEHKLHGLINTIVQSVRDKSIDIHHVFSKDFAIEHGYDESNRQVFLDQLRNNWYDSLPYINSVDPEDAMEIFGVFTIADGTPYNGAEVACWVMKNIFANFLIDGEMFLQNTIPNSYLSNILFDTNDFWDAKRIFAYCSPEGDTIQFCADSNLNAEDEKLYATNPQTDLMRLFEYILPEQMNLSNDNPPLVGSLHIYGYMASLIYAMFADTARRKVLRLNWFNADLMTMEELTLPIVTLYPDDLPINLHIQAYKVHAAYFHTALDALQTILSDREAACDDTPEYITRKMLAIELNQRQHLNDSPLWLAFPDSVQRMLLERLNLFITFLREKCGIDASTSIQQLIQDNQPFKYFHYEVTDPDEKLRVHEMVCNIVHQPQMNLVCNSLHELMKNKKILSQIDPQKMLMELRRLGLPDENTKGFSDKNFYSFFNA